MEKVIHCSKQRDTIVVNEIEERKKFLEEARKLGQGEKYESVIKGQIAEVFCFSIVSDPPRNCETWSN